MFRQLQRQVPNGWDVRVLFHAAAAECVPRLLFAVPHEVVMTAEVMTPLYQGKFLRADAVAALADKGHTDLVLLALWRRGCRWNHVWVVEYDVRFSGNWQRFFAAFGESDAGLLAAAVRRRQDDPAWVHWSTLGSALGVLGNAQMACFMPVFRASAELIAAVDQAYRHGLKGHLEAVWPTLATILGLGVEDLGGQGPFVVPANRGRFYKATVGEWDLAPGSFAFRPVRMCAGLRRELLWHPVKSPGAKLSAEITRISEWFRTRLGRLH